MQFALKLIDVAAAVIPFSLAMYLFAKQTSPRPSCRLGDGEPAQGGELPTAASPDSARAELGLHDVIADRTSVGSEDRNGGVRGVIAGPAAKSARTPPREVAGSNPAGRHQDGIGSVVPPGTESRYGLDERRPVIRRDSRERPA